MHAYIHPYIHTYVHTYIHTYIHTRTKLAFRINLSTFEVTTLAGGRRLGAYSNGAGSRANFDKVVK